MRKVKLNHDETLVYNTIKRGHKNGSRWATYSFTSTENNAIKSLVEKDVVYIYNGLVGIVTRADTEVILS